MFLKEIAKNYLTQDESGEYHSGAYLVGIKTPHGILIAGNPNLRNSGSTSKLLIWEAIKFSFKCFQSI